MVQGVRTFLLGTLCCLFFFSCEKERLSIAEKKIISLFVSKLGDNKAKDLARFSSLLVADSLEQTKLLKNLEKKLTVLKQEKESILAHLKQQKNNVSQIGSLEYDIISLSSQNERLMSQKELKEKTYYSTLEVRFFYPYTFSGKAIREQVMTKKIAGGDFETYHKTYEADVVERRRAYTSLRFELSLICPHLKYAKVVNCRIVSLK